MRGYSTVATVFTSVAMLCAVGCQPAGTARLVPSTGDTTVDGVAGVVKEIDNVRLQIVPMWPGDEEVNDYSTPMRVTIENNSDMPLMIRYEYFELASEDGPTFTALPVFQVDAGTVPGARAQVEADADVVSNPAFEHAGFAVAPYLSSAYPGLPVYSGVFDYNSQYYERYGDRLSQRDLPSEVYRRALPEGVLQSGGRISGFVFLERVSADTEAAILRISLVNARDGNAFSIAAVPFRVVEEETMAN